MSNSGSYLWKGVCWIAVVAPAAGWSGCSTGDLTGLSKADPELGAVRSALIQTNPPVAIRQVYGGGGNASAPLTNDFVELFNRSNSPQSLSGWSVQYTSATGTGLLGATGLITVLPGMTLAPGQSFLVQEASGGATGSPLPTPDVSGGINMSATAGKVALVNSTTSLGCNGGSTPCSDAQTSLIIDLVGYGSANFFEGSAAAPSASNTAAVLRANGGCQDTNDNAADFAAGTPTPRNTASPVAPCGVGDAGSDGSTSDAGADGSTSDAGSDAGSGLGACGDPSDLIGPIQGTGAASPVVGHTVTIEGVVVGDFQDNPINGFFVQQEDGKGDGNPATSDGIFVFEGTSSVPSVAAGDLVRVRGQVAEFNNLTELTSITNVMVCPGSHAASAQPLTFPAPSTTDFERFEGMLVSISQPLTVTGNFGLGRFGYLDLAVGDPLSDGGAPLGRRLFQPTQVVAPGASALALQDLNNRSRIILDDLSNSQDPNPIPYKDTNNTRRVGDMLPSLVGVLDGSFPSDGSYRVRPTTAVSFVTGNPRAVAPTVGGNLRVVSANVLNYFVTLDSGASKCGGSSCALDCRGANTATEFTRQRTKLLNQFQSLDADIACVTELENPGCATGTTPEAAQDLVNGINGRFAPGTYDFVHPPTTIGTDAIKVGLLYKPGKVRPVCTTRVLDGSFDSRYIDTRNRPALTQSFEEIATGARFTIVCNHLKSKGSACTPDDPDANDGQGNCNGTRTKAAQVLLSWIASDPTGCADPDYMIAGDLNAYAKEDPITTLKAGGLRLLDADGSDGWSYQFQAQSGSLDHVLATASLASQITGAAEWHNNADEPSVLDYNQEFKTDDPFSINDPFRAADHDPIVIGVSLHGVSSSVPATGGSQLTGLALLLFAMGFLGVRGRATRA